MSEHIAAPRITAASLDTFVNKHVSIVGKVTQLRGDQATIDADGNVTILLNRVRLLLTPRPSCLSKFELGTNSFDRRKRTSPTATPLSSSARSTPISRSKR